MTGETQAAAISHAVKNSILNVEGVKWWPSACLSWCSV